MRVTAVEASALGILPNDNGELLFLGRAESKIPQIINWRALNFMADANCMDIVHTTFENE